MASSTLHYNCPPPPVSLSSHEAGVPNCRSDTVVAARHAQSKAFNPNIDRHPAKLYHPDASKTTIIIRHQAPMPTTRREYSYEVDWADQKSVSYLNLWRARLFRYWFGVIPGEKAPPTYKYFCKEERVWLLRNTKDGKFTWNDIVERFNQEFAGVRIKGCLIERPARTEKRLRALWRRLQKQEMKAPRVEYDEESESELEEGEIREDELEEGEIKEYPQTARSTRPWEL